MNLGGEQTALARLLPPCQHLHQPVEILLALPERLDRHALVAAMRPIVAELGASPECA
jgi:hypothetical protein